MKFHSIRKIFLIFVFITIYLDKSFAQEGVQLSVYGMGGVGVIAPQNHYDNSFYELDYKLKMTFGGIASVGYGFDDMFSVHALVGYQKIQNGYKGEFRPGLGAPPQSHQKDIQLDYLQIGVIGKMATSFKDSYVYDTRAQLIVGAGFLMGILMNADLKYTANGELVPYPSKLIPYADPNYQYEPNNDPKSFFTGWNLQFVLQVGTDIFLSDKFALTPLIQGQASILDINAKNYRKHDGYKASRTLYGGLNLGFTYYLNR